MPEAHTYAQNRSPGPQIQGNIMIWYIIIGDTVNISKQTLCNISLKYLKIVL